MILPLLAAILLPIEVFGPVGFVVKRNVNLYVIPPTNTVLHLTAQGLPENKASVRVNAGPWIFLNNTNAQFPVRETAFFKMAEQGKTPGPLHVMRMSLALPGWIKGKNVLEWRYNGDPLSTSGFRVIRFNVMANGTNLLPETEFNQEDPSAWVPPLTGSADIAEGERLYKSGPLVFNLKYGQHIDVQGSPLRTTCSGCHSPDGIDLKFFNFPASSIINECMSLGMNKKSGQQIASWILTRPIPYNAKARPWNSPYQPGPGLDSRPIEDWVAGVGYDKVLDDDLETIRQIGTNVHFQETLSAREIQLACPLPTWQQWMPRVQPLDLPWPDMATNRYYTIFDEITNRLGTTTGIEAARIFEPYETKWDQAGQYLPPKPADKTSPEYKVYAYSRKAAEHWRVVRTWHLMVKHQMQDVGLELYGPLSDDRRWFHGSVFRLGPHMLGLPHSKTNYLTFHQDSMIWYQAQLVLNSGNRSNPSIVPIDVGYLKALCRSSFNNPTNYPFYGIWILNLIKSGEMPVDGQVMGPKNTGWNPFYCGVNEIVNITQKAFIAWIPEDIRRRTSETVVLAWLEQSEKYTKAQYDDLGYLKDGTLLGAVNYTATELENLNGDPAIIARLHAFADKISSMEGGE